MIDLLLIETGDDHGNPRRESELMESPRIHGCHPGAAQGEIGEHDRTWIYWCALLVAVQSPTVRVVEQGNPGVGGLFCVGVVGTAEHEGWDDEGAWLTSWVSKHELPRHAEAVTNPRIALREGILAQLREHAAGAQLFIEFIKVGAGLLLAAEQKWVEVQETTDRRIRGILIATIDE